MQMKPDIPKPDVAGDKPSMTILLIDDDPDCRLLFRDAIEESRRDCQVLEVTNGLEAMDLLKRRGRWSDAPRPGLIFLDVEMPGMGGQETLRAIRELPDFADTPVVMMTGMSDEVQMRLAAENGANSYTLKPSSGSQFLETVRASANYWLKIHQYPEHRLPQSACRR